MTDALDLQLAAIVGPGGVVPADERAAYEIGLRCAPGISAAVVWPTDAEQIQALFRLARERGLTLLPQGAHTGLVGAGTPRADASQIVVATHRLAAIDIDAADRVAICGAGVRLSALNAAAAEQGLELPIDLGADPSLGGMVATNTGGARLIRHGDMRRRVLGVEAVLPDGRLFSDMRALRKNATGLDLKQVFIGSAGRFGVITRVAVELAPMPRQSATMLLAPASLDALPAIIGALERDLGDLLTACEGMSAAALGAAIAVVPNGRSPFAELPEFALLVEASSALARDDAFDIDARLEACVEALLTAPRPLVTDAAMARGNEFWSLRHAIGEGLAHRGKVIGHDIAVRRRDVPALRAVLEARVRAAFPALEIADFGHIGDGGLHYNLVVPHGTAAESSLEFAVRELVYRTVVEDFGGTFSAEHGVGPVNAWATKLFRTAIECDLDAALANAITA